MKILIYDLETNGVDTSICEPKLGGFVSTEFEGFKYTSSIPEMARIINSHDIIVGYNIKGFDNLIMERFGASFYGKIIIDLYEVIDKRKGVMKIKGKGYLNSILTDRSMDTLCHILDGPKKLTDEIDYNWFKVDFHTLSDDIQKKCIEYLKRDIEMTEYVYKYVENFFSDFKEYLPQDQVEKKQYLTSSIATYAYKVICHLAGLKEEYADDDPHDYGGGFVAVPTVESATGDIYCLDFSSEYPHAMMQCNLYGRVTDGNPLNRPTWKGTGINFTEGTYYADEMAPVGKVLMNFYNKRLEYKKTKDSREYTIKIIINTIYGLLGKSVFKSVNDWVAAADCTRLGRQWINFARKRFAEEGYECLYTDTDSVYVRDIKQDKLALLKVVKSIVEEIKASVPFPQDTFDMTIDDEIKYIQFVRAADGVMLKKNYLYVTKDNRVVIKGFQIIKSSASNIGRLVFERHIKPELLNNLNGKFPKSQILQWIYYILAEDKENAAVRFKVKDAEMYKSPTQLQRMIAEHKDYGTGQHMMIRLRQRHLKGAGVNGTYVGAKFKDDINLSDIVLDKTINEMYPFIGDSQSALDKWIKG